jgi:hypothetical protein
LDQEKRKGRNVEDVNDMELQNGLKYCFMGYIPPYDVETEISSWMLIKETALEALMKYPNTLKEDIVLLEKDELE